MPVVSVSLNDDLLKGVDDLQKQGGYSGRSEVVRTALRTLLADSKGEQELSGIIEGVLIISNKEAFNDDVTVIRHQFGSIVKTEVHNHLDNHQCLHLLVLRGKAEKVKQMIDACRSSRRIDYVRLVVA